MQHQVILTSVGWDSTSSLSLGCADYVSVQGSVSSSSGGNVRVPVASKAVLLDALSRVNNRGIFGVKVCMSRVPHSSSGDNDGYARPSPLQQITYLLRLRDKPNLSSVIGIRCRTPGR
jgi:hypothetical protein